MFLKIFQNSLENARPQVCNFIKKETLAQMFSFEFWEIFKNTFLTEHLWMTASQTLKLLQECQYQFSTRFRIVNRVRHWLINMATALNFTINKDHQLRWCLHESFWQKWNFISGVQSFVKTTPRWKKETCYWNWCCGIRKWNQKYFVPKKQSLYYHYSQLQLTKISFINGTSEKCFWLILLVKRGII